MAWIEAGINRPQRREAAHHQSRTDQQNQGQRYFNGNEDSIETMTSAARAASAFIQYFLQIHA